MEYVTWDSICDRMYLERACDLALLSGNKSMTKAKRLFSSNRKHLMDILEQSMRDGTYQFSELYSFEIYEPKKRKIDVPKFYPDRIIHRAVMDKVKNVIVSRLIDNTFSSIEGRGLHQCAELVKKAVANNPDGYYVKVDVSHCFQSVNHDILKGLLKELPIDNRTYDCLCRIIDRHNEGLAIGVYPSQYLSNYYFVELDRAISSRYANYYRYMDDIVVIVPTKSEALAAYKMIEDEFDKLKLKIKNTWRISPIIRGIDFIGYVFYPTHTRLRKSIKLAAQKKAKSLNKRRVSDDVFKMQMASYYGWFIHGDCANLWRRIKGNRHIVMAEDIKRLSELKRVHFGMQPTQRVSINDIVGQDITIIDYMLDTIRGEEKVFVKFVTSDGEERYFITKSEVIKDRVIAAKQYMPCVAQVLQKIGRAGNKYFVIE